MSSTAKANVTRSERNDHSFVARVLTIYTKPAQILIKRHFARLDASFLRLSNDFLWMNDDQHILAMIQKRTEIISEFATEIDGIIETYKANLQKHHINAVDIKKLKPIETVSLELHASASVEAVSLFQKLDLIFLLLEAMKQNGLIDELAFVHTCNAWKTSTGVFVKNIHELRTQLMQESQARLNQKSNR